MCAILPGGESALVVEDNQRGQIYIKQIQMNMHQQTTGMPYLLEERQSIQQIIRARMGKNASWRATYSLSIVHFYAIAFATTKPIFSLYVVAVLRPAQKNVWRFTLLQVMNKPFAATKLCEYCQSIFPCTNSGKSMRINKRQSIHMCLPDKGLTWKI